MLRRNFIKVALSGLAALGLRKGPDPNGSRGENHQADDDDIIVLKSSDVTGGLCVGELDANADTYFTLVKNDSNHAMAKQEIL